LLLIDATRRLERGGADFVLICTDTMHRGAAAVARVTAGGGLPKWRPTIRDGVVFSAQGCLMLEG